MKQINLQKTQIKLRNKFIKAGVKMIGPETIFFSEDTKIGINVIINPYVVIGKKVKLGNLTSITSHTILKFEETLKIVCLDLAKQIVVDGEGAKKFITIKIINSKSVSIAKKIAFSIANSPLFKTAVAGEDPNWGRIVMGIGKSFEKIDMKKLTIKIGSFILKYNILL